MAALRFAHHRTHLNQALQCSVMVFETLCAPGSREDGLLLQPPFIMATADKDEAAFDANNRLTRDEWERNCNRWRCSAETGLERNMAELTAYMAISCRLDAGKELPKSIGLRSNSVLESSAWT